MATALHAVGNFYLRLPSTVDSTPPQYFDRIIAYSTGLIAGSSYSECAFSNSQVDNGLDVGVYVDPFPTNRSMMSIRKERARRIRSVVTITVFFTLFGVTYEFMETGQFGVWGPIIGFMLGLMLGFFENVVFANRFVGFSFTTTILTKTFAYVGIILVILIGTGLIAGYAQGLVFGDFVEEISSRSFWSKLGISFAVFLAVIFFLERTRLDAENERKDVELEKAQELEKAYGALEDAHRNLKAAQAQLVQAEKLASLGALTAGIAHEIKNPLNFINNFAEINEDLADELRDALNEGDSDEVLALLDDLKQNASVIVKNGKRADRIVHSMMQHASGGQGQRGKTDINGLVAEHTDLAYHGKRAETPGLSVKIVRKLGEDAGEVEMVPQEIGRVLLNLLGNAIDAVHELAGTADQAYEPVVTVSTQRLEDSVEISVSDNGPGVPLDIQTKVFEPFFTTKPSGIGTGLGLSMSYDIVTQGHGGTLTLESDTEKGATFIVSLPSSLSAAPRVTEIV